MKFFCLFTTAFLFSPFLLLAQQDSLQKTFVKQQKGFFNSFDGTKIYYEVKGNGYPVVLIHGFIVNGESWKKTPLYNDLIDSGFRVITMDLRGNGQSGKPHRPEAYDHDAEAKDIMGIVRMLQVKKYSVVGYSRGAIIASRVLIFDEHVSIAVIGGMGTGFTNPEWPRRKMFYKALIGEQVKELEAMVQNVKKSGLDQIALAYSQKGQPSTSKKEFSKVKKPVLVIAGDKDEDNGSSKELAEFIPGSLHTTVPGDHGSALNSKEFSIQVISFLRKNHL